MTGQPQMPKSWRLVRLGDVAHIRNNRATAGEDERMPYVALEHILSGGRLTTHGKSDDRNIPPDQRAGQPRRRTSLLECACHLGFGLGPDIRLYGQRPHYEARALEETDSPGPAQPDDSIVIAFLLEGHAALLEQPCLQGGPAQQPCNAYLGAAG